MSFLHLHSTLRLSYISKKKKKKNCCGITASYIQNVLWDTQRYECHMNVQLEGFHVFVNITADLLQFNPHAIKNSYAKFLPFQIRYYCDSTFLLSKCLGRHRGEVRSLLHCHEATLYLSVINNARVLTNPTEWLYLQAVLLLRSLRQGSSNGKCTVGPTPAALRKPSFRD